MRLSHLWFLNETLTTCTAILNTFDSLGKGEVSGSSTDEGT